MMKHLLMLTVAVYAVISGASARYENRHLCCSHEVRPFLPEGCRRCVNPPPGTITPSGYTTCHVCYNCPTAPDQIPSSDYAVCPGISGSGLDPHFIVENHNSDVKLCFDYSGSSEQVIKLIQDDESDTHVTAQLHQWDKYRNSNVFSKINIRLGGVAMEFGFEDILVDNKTLEKSWTMTSPFMHDDITISPLRHDILEVHNSQNDVTLTVTRHKGELIGYYLGVYVTDKGAISREAGGMLGQFFFAGMDIEDDYMTLTFPDAPSKRVPVTLEMKYAIGSIESDEECWHYDSHKDRSLTGDGAKIGDSLLGEYHQYILDDE